MQTRLDVINAMIVSTGARPLLAGQDRHPMYLKADQLLSRVVGTVLSMGLWFNTECRVIEAQENEEILVPIGCISADPTERQYNLTMRGNRMYDLDKGAPYNGRSLRLNMKFEINYEEIPITAQNYIDARAVYEFFLNENGADPKLSNYRAERDTYWTLLWREHTRHRQVNVFDGIGSTVNRLRRGHSPAASNLHFLGRHK